MTAPLRRVAPSVVLDLLAVAVFVTIGRRSHDEGSALEQIVETAAPFVIGLALGWLLARAWRSPLAVETGVMIWPVTIVIGMLGRRFVFDRGTAPSFVIVATVFPRPVLRRLAGALPG